VSDAEQPDEPSEQEQPPPTRYGVPVTFSRGQEVLHPAREQLLEVATAARDDGFGFLVDVTAVDYLLHDRSDLPAGVDPERFEVVVALRNHRERSYIRLRVQVPEADPSVPTLFDLWPGCEALEREVFDMFGIEFTDHPDMTRILMPEDWLGHPLRKDFAIGRIPVQFKDAPSTR
jgi:NADH-quinone oxidoreductase subunit C